MGRKNSRSNRQAEQTQEKNVDQEQLVEETVEETVDETVEKPQEETVKETVEETPASAEEEEEHPAIKNIRNILKDYNAIAMKPAFDKSVVSAHYNLYYTIKNILNNENTEIRTKQLTAVCDAFKQYKNEGFNKVKLFRFDIDWKWSKESIDAMNLITMLFLELHDASKRENNKKSVDFKNIHELKDLTNEQKQRLEDYFYV